MSQSEVELASSGGPPLLDGGFSRTGKPPSVFPPSPGAEAELRDFGTDAEPVSLHDLGVVLGRAPKPPAWSGGPAHAEPAPRNAAEKGKKPRFFQVDPVPPTEEVPCDLEEPRAPERAPDSGHEDLRRLIAPRAESASHRRTSDIFGLRGGLFADAPKPPLVPLDLSALLADDSAVPPTTGAERAPDTPEPRPAPEPTSVEVVPRAPAVPADLVGLAPPPEEPPAEPSGDRGVRDPSETPAMKQGSGAPGPVVAERRASAARRSGIASWAVVVSVSATSAAAIVVALRMGASTPHDARMTEAPSAPALALPPPDTATQPAAPHPSSPPPPPAHDERDPSAPRPAPPTLPDPPARPVEPARVVTERPPAATPIAAAAPSPAPPPAAHPAAAPPPGVAPPRAAAPPATGADFDQAAARVALSMAAAQASGCKQPDDPGGGTRISVTFAPSGRAVSAHVTGPPFQGTRTGACIARTFHGVTVPPFSGDPVTVTKTVTVR